jgi:TPR repeat protein
MCKNATAGKIEDAISSGANVNARDGKGWTPLMYAARYNSRPEAATALLAAGADPDVVGDDGNDALSLAKKNKNQAVYLLINDYAKNRPAYAAVPRANPAPVASYGGEDPDFLKAEELWGDGEFLKTEPDPNDPGIINYVITGADKARGNLAVEHYKKAAARGHRKAIAKLANISILFVAQYVGLTREDARRWGAKAADNGDPEGFYVLGIIYFYDDTFDIHPDQRLPLFKKGLEYMKVASSMAYRAAIEAASKMQGIINGVETVAKNVESYANADDEESTAEKFQKWQQAWGMAETIIHMGN